MNVDYLIVGHGLAGATLAWHLRWLGQQVAVVDDESTNSASRVAAGLISPITGRRNAVSYRYAEFWKDACKFYRSVEEQTGTRFFFEPRTLRCVGEGKGQQLNESAHCGDYVSDVVFTPPPFKPQSAVELLDAARLCVPSFLEASRRDLNRIGCYISGEIDPDSDLQFSEDVVCVHSLGIEAKRIVFCQGIKATNHRLFGELPFEPTKGEVLELDAPELKGLPTLLSDVWVIPSEQGRCLLGASYNRVFDTDLPTQEVSQELLGQFARLVDIPARVLEHRAAVRPTMRGRLPQFGLHPKDPRIGFFNGLGSKGALRAPKTTGQFAAFLVRGEPVDSEFWYDSSATNRSGERLTTTAHRIISEAISSGDTVIDATAGNGFDTVFLSQAVGQTGCVYSLDVQQEAISRTEAKVQSGGLPNVKLVLGSHADLCRHVPSELHGKIAAIMFNLGYLPRGDRQFTTEAASTREAVMHGIRLLQVGGVITILAYTGHAGGVEEAHAIELLLASASIQECCSVELPPTRITVGPPRMYVLRKTIQLP